MLIVVDARPLIQQRVGFGNLLYNTLLEILKFDKDNEYLLLSDRDVVFPTEKYQNVSIERYKDNIFCPKSFYYYLMLGQYLKKKHIDPDVFWATEHLMPQGLPHKTNKILTLCDFTHIKFPKSTTKYNLLLSKLFFRPSIKNSDKIACISQNTQNELVKFYPKEIQGKFVKTIYLGGINDQASVQQNEKNISDKVTQIIKKKYIVFIGTIEPRKNISLLINAAPKLKDKIHIVVCGKIGWEKENIIEQLNDTENLTYLNYVSLTDKNILIKNSFCQVQPSLYEGFGLPIVESMQCGTVTLVADNSSLHELVEIPELRFETKNVDDFCNKLLHLINNKDLYNNAKSYCLKRGKEFSWSKTAMEYYNLFLAKQ